jgi:hypothetical protein
LRDQAYKLSPKKDESRNTRACISKFTFTAIYFSKLLAPSEQRRNSPTSETELQLQKPYFIQQGSEFRGIAW